jgi:hypothetical protein
MRWVLLVVALVVPRLAEARPVGVVMRGDSHAMVPQLIDEWLRDHGHEVVGFGLPDDAVNLLSDCLTVSDLSCSRKVVERRATVETIVSVRIDATTRTELQLSGSWIAKGRDVVSVQRVCTNCSEEALRSTVDTLLQDLVRLTAATVPVALEPGPEGPARSGRLMPSLMIGVGIAALIGGGVLYATSEEMSGERPTYTDTKPVGIGVALGGAVAVGVGAFLFVRAPRATPTIAIAPGGATIGWAGAF